MISPDDNPYASPAATTDGLVDRMQEMPGNLDRWAVLTLLYSGLVSAVLFGIIGLAVFLFAVPKGGSFGEFFLDAQGNLTSEGVTELTTIFVSLVVIAGLLGGLSGFVHGCFAFRARSNPGKRRSVDVIGFALPLIFLGTPALIFALLAQGLIVNWRVASVVIFVICALLVGERVNRFIRKHLLSELTAWGLSETGSDGQA